MNEEAGEDRYEAVLAYVKKKNHENNYNLPAGDTATRI